MRKLIVLATLLLGGVLVAGVAGATPDTGSATTIQLAPGTGTDPAASGTATLTREARSGLCYEIDVVGIGTPTGARISGPEGELVLSGTIEATGPDSYRLSGCLSAREVGQNRELLGGILLDPGQYVLVVNGSAGSLQGSVA